MGLLLFMALTSYLVASSLGPMTIVGDRVLVLVGPSVLERIAYTHLVASIAHFSAVFLLLHYGIDSLNAYAVSRSTCGKARSRSSGLVSPLARCRRDESLFGLSQRFHLFISAP